MGAWWGTAVQALRSFLWTAAAAAAATAAEVALVVPRVTPSPHLPALIHNTIQILTHRHLIATRSKLSEHFLALARDLDVLEPKVPEDVYKSHLIGEIRI